MFPPETKILIVDDSLVMLENIRNELNVLGFNNIIQAEDGVLGFTALEGAANSPAPVQLVICDWNMPNMTGIDLLKKVRALPNWANLPFILLTAASQVSEVVEAITAGVSTYMVKPLDQKALKEKLEAVWKKHHGPKK